MPDLISLEDLPCPSLVLDMSTWKPLAFNRRASEMMRYTPDEFARLTITDFELVPNPAETADHIGALRRSRRDVFSALHRTKNGDPLSVQVQVNMLRWKDRDAMLTVWNTFEGSSSRTSALVEPMGVHNSTIIARSPAMLTLLERADRIARTNLTVLIQGETGTGKDLLARRVHARSRRAAGVFMPINCASLPPELVDAELFGAERGAFTGADRRRAGRFEVADGGTVFLDEVGELDLKTQAKLLRVLENGEVHRLGAALPGRVDVRVIAATNRDLAAMVTAGQFRLDLLHRISSAVLKVPPLRERREDIDAIIEHIVSKTENAIPSMTFSQTDIERLRAWNWPGNVRELLHVVELSLALADQGVPILHDWHPMNHNGDTRTVVVGTFEDSVRALLLECMEQSGWTVEGPSGAASRLGLRPSTLRSKLDRFGVTRSQPSRDLK
jgi:transcriptional regulator with GAF, ATPase, and Fis domain